jgi:hypothetical protein
MRLRRRILSLIATYRIVLPPADSASNVDLEEDGDGDGGDDDDDDDDVAGP